MSSWTADILKILFLEWQRKLFCQNLNILTAWLQLQIFFLCLRATLSIMLIIGQRIMRKISQQLAWQDIPRHQILQTQMTTLGLKMTMLRTWHHYNMLLLYHCGFWMFLCFTVLRFAPAFWNQPEYFVGLNVILKIMTKNSTEKWTDNRWCYFDR